MPSEGEGAQTQQSLGGVDPRGRRIVRTIAFAQIALPLWQILRRRFAETHHTIVLGMDVRGTPAFVYGLVLAVLWVIAGVGLWRLSAKGWAISMVLYAWALLNLLILCALLFFAGPSQIPMPSGKLFAAVVFLVAVLISLVARAVYRRRDLFR